MTRPYRAAFGARASSDDARFVHSFIRAHTRRRDTFMVFVVTPTRAIPASVARETTREGRRDVRSTCARVVRARASPDDDETRASSSSESSASSTRDVVERARRASAREQKPRRRAESTDAVATFMTRRFGLKGGLAWLGVLTFGVVSEQVKTRRETRDAVANTRDVDASARTSVDVGDTGVSYTEMTIGGGELVREGYLIAAKVRATGRESGKTIFDTKATGREIVWSYGGRLGPPLCVGLEIGARGMRQGGRRLVRVPAKLAVGVAEEDVEFDVTLTRVSVPPS